MSDALVRIKARAQARTAAAGDMPPAAPGAPPAEEPAGDVNQRLGDLEETVMELQGTVDQMQQAMVEDVLADMDEEVPVAAALPEKPAGEPVLSIEERLAALEARQSVEV